MKFPEIIITGVMKSGTTALWYNLDKHPKINMIQPEKNRIDMNFWGHDLPKEFTIEWYKSKFSGKISGEKSVDYSFKSNSMELIKKYIPNVKLFLCLRNPVDRAYSNYCMNKKANLESQNYNYDLLEKYFHPGKYIESIDNILSFFKREQLHICILEHMKKDLTREMKKVFEFIGVEDLNYSMKNLPVRKEISRDEDIKLSRTEKFYRVWSSDNEKLRSDVREKGVEFFKPYNEKFFEFLGYEIEEWKK